MYLSNSCRRPASGGSTFTMRSNRPARVRALSSMSARLVPRMRTPPFSRCAFLEPAKQAATLFFFFCGSCPSLRGADLGGFAVDQLPILADWRLPMVSISSMKMMQRPCQVPCETAASPWPCRRRHTRCEIAPRKADEGRPPHLPSLWP